MNNEELINDLIETRKQMNNAVSERKKASGDIKQFKEHEEKLIRLLEELKQEV